MKWVTRDYVHFDRVATPWLIRRFVDPEAVFVFVPWGREGERPDDALAFAIPGVELSDHDARGTTFSKVLAKYGLDDPALQAMGRMVAMGVDYALHGTEPAGGHAADIVEGVMAVALGVMLLTRDDAEQIERSFVIYDALYEVFRMQLLMEARGEAQPPGSMSGELWRTLFSVALSRRLRPEGRSFADVGPDAADAGFDAILSAMRKQVVGD